MKKLILRELNENDEAAFLNGYEDWKNEKLTWYTFVWKPGMSHSEHLQLLSCFKNRSQIEKQYVPSTMLYGFVDGEIVGRISVRHELNDNLLARGGHIGYAVSPRFRGQGFATDIMKQGLDFCKSLGLKRILVTCSDHNTPSWKIIEKFDAVLENKVLDTEKNEQIRRYWIELKN
jgi:predicted acetyltransferase